MKQVCNKCKMYGPCTLENNYDYVYPVSCPLEGNEYTRAEWEDVEDDMEGEEEFCGDPAQAPPMGPVKVYHTAIEVSKFQLLRIRKIITQIGLTGKSSTCVGTPEGESVRDGYGRDSCKGICRTAFRYADEEQTCPCHCSKYDGKDVMQKFNEILDYNLSLMD